MCDLIVLEFVTPNKGEVRVLCVPEGHCPQGVKKTIEKKVKMIFESMMICLHPADSSETSESQ